MMIDLGPPEPHHIPTQQPEKAASRFLHASFSSSFVLVSSSERRRFANSSTGHPGSQENVPCGLCVQARSVEPPYGVTKSDGTMLV
jgi:hypothetical protein